MKSVVLQEQPTRGGALFLFLGSPGLGQRMRIQVRYRSAIRDSAVAGLVFRTHQPEQMRTHREPNPHLYAYHVEAGFAHARPP